MESVYNLNKHNTNIFILQINLGCYKQVAEHPPNSIAVVFVICQMVVCVNFTFPSLYLSIYWIVKKNVMF
jgi:hypothetical protein